MIKWTEPKAKAIGGGIFAVFALAYYLYYYVPFSIFAARADAQILPITKMCSHCYEPYSIEGERYYPLGHARNFSQVGEASWYGPGFHKNETSNGEIFSMYQMTAAHPTLPIPSYVKVENYANNTSVIVRVNDRGPFKGNRAIDLSYAAALKLGIVEKGVAKVLITVIDDNRYTADLD